jgi:hypothetical protein
VVKVSQGLRSRSEAFLSMIKLTLDFEELVQKWIANDPAFGDALRQRS